MKHTNWYALNSTWNPFFFFLSCSKYNLSVLSNLIWFNSKKKVPNHSRADHHLTSPQVIILSQILQDHIAFGCAMKFVTYFCISGDGCVLYQLGAHSSTRTLSQFKFKLLAYLPCSDKTYTNKLFYLIFGLTNQTVSFTFLIIYGTGG